MSWSDGRRLPVHFIFGLSDKSGERAFAFCHYLAVRAAHTFLQPAELLLHYGHAPDGDQRWWQEAQKLASLRQVKAPRSIFGRPLRTAAHRADVLRLQLLIEHGGVYLDMDVVVLRNVHALFDGPKDFVIGREGSASHGGLHGLCNAVLLARPNASFARRWLREYHDFGDPAAGDLWSEHSVQRAVKLAHAHPEEVAVLHHTAFFWPDWDDRQLDHLLLEQRTGALAHLRMSTTARAGHVGYGVHLWSSLSSALVLSQWSPEYLSSVPSDLNCILHSALGLAPEGAAPPVVASIAVNRNCSCSSAATVVPTQGGVPVTTVLAHWPLRKPSDASWRWLADTSGNCNHGWIYGRADEVAAQQQFWTDDGDDDLGGVLRMQSEPQAFIPLPRDGLLGHDSWSVSWFARIRGEAQRALCGEGVLPFWTLTLSEDDHLSVSAVRSGGEGGAAALIPRVRWTSGRHTLFDSSLDGYGDTGTERIDVCGSGWHRYVLTVSSPPAITLHVDGEAGAAVSWRADVSGGLFRRGPSTASLPARGIWLGRAAPTAISKGVFPGEPREATLEMVDLALFIGMGEDASPDALPAQVTFKSWRRPTDRTPNIGQRVGVIGRVTHVRAWHSTWFACVALAALLAAYLITSLRLRERCSRAARGTRSMARSRDE